jgi:hypothetical protein
VLLSKQYKQEEMNLIPGQLLKNKLDSFPLQSRLSQQTTALRKRSTRQPLFKKKKNQRETENHYIPESMEEI